MFLCKNLKVLYLNKKCFTVLLLILLLNVIQFTGKSHVEQYIRTSGIPNMTFAYLGFYNQNIGANTILIPNENDEVELAISYLEENDQLPMIDVDGDTGVRVY